MENPNFEPFGEQLTLQESVRAPGHSQSSLLRIGSGIFWFFAIVIVVARAIYFHPAIFDGFDRTLALVERLKAVL